MIVGYTGTQTGMDDLQFAYLEAVLARLCPEEAHHGDCIGGDAQFHQTVRRVLPRCRIAIHPPDVTAKRAFCEGDFAYPPAPYLVRNAVIVLSVDEMIGAPKSRAEELRSGTWATIRTARRCEKNIHMLWPRG